MMAGRCSDRHSPAVNHRRRYTVVPQRCSRLLKRSPGVRNAGARKLQEEVGNQKLARRDTPT